jgi:prophage tail gpP-like protein
VGRRVPIGFTAILPYANHDAVLYEHAPDGYVIVRSGSYRSVEGLAHEALVVLFHVVEA